MIFILVGAANLPKADADASIISAPKFDDLADIPAIITGQPRPLIEAGVSSLLYLFVVHRVLIIFFSGPRNL